MPCEGTACPSQTPLETLEEGATPHYSAPPPVYHTSHIMRSALHTIGMLASHELEYYIMEAAILESKETRSQRSLEGWACIPAL